MTPQNQPSQDPSSVPSQGVPPHDEADMARLALDIQKIEDHKTAPIPGAQPIGVTPTSTPQDILSQAIITAPKKSKKKWILGPVIALFVIAFGSGSWAAYALWYQNPDKIVNDALLKSVLAKTTSIDGSIALTSKSGVDATIGVKGQGGLRDGISGRMSLDYKFNDNLTLKFGADGMRTANGDYYLRLFGLQDTYNTIMNAAGNSSQVGEASTANEQTINYASALVQPFIDKLDNQWIKFSAVNIRDYDKKIADQYDCTNNVLTKAGNDTNRTQLREVGNLYQKYKIVVIDKDLGTKQGNIGLLVHIDQRALNQFSRALEKTQLAKDLKACWGVSGDAIESSDDKTVDKNPQQFELWVDQWGHDLRRFYMKTDIGKGQDAMTYVADFSLKSNEPLTVNAPSESKTIDQLFPELKSQLGASLAQSI